jgi:hypothetical protein
MDPDQIYTDPLDRLVALEQWVDDFVVHTLMGCAATIVTCYAALALAVRFAV